jgi:hypothetical protein
LPLLNARIGWCRAPLLHFQMRTGLWWSSGNLVIRCDKWHVIVVLHSFLDTFSFGYLFFLL